MHFSSAINESIYSIIVIMFFETKKQNNRYSKEKRIFKRLYTKGKCKVEKDVENKFKRTQNKTALQA